eukprot:CAMPEP_0203759126 /NCGR_PEP_ID=MMETSP0098-20131031/12063_1 /ASSEMBLY_ACC=CAM_ASM_000208 /TAXON_ID=96639 /ORGANISM=" , Strain NY0313808BC1" /LENGTH=82 /DNA_ID=CAMNT_0050651885 /DNA_START=105 /DNA_END=350 /DNA_ORIENTATION=+
MPEEEEWLPLVERDTMSQEIEHMEKCATEFVESWPNIQRCEENSVVEKLVKNLESSVTSMQVALENFVEESRASGKVLEKLK